MRPVKSAIGLTKPLTKPKITKSSPEYAANSAKNTATMDMNKPTSVKI
jgi:hypothetical protein